MKDVFISYSKRDKKIVNKFYDSLVQAGFDVWIDEKQIDLGAGYEAKITSAIRECQVVVFFSSKNSNVSSDVDNEICVADQYGKKIIPIKLDKTDYSDSLTYRLAKTQYLPCFSRKETDINGYKLHLINDLLKYIDRPDSNEFLCCPNCKSTKLMVKLQNYNFEENRDKAIDSTISTGLIVSTTGYGASAGAFLGPWGMAAGSVLGAGIGIGLDFLRSKRSKDKAIDGKDVDSSNEKPVNIKEMPYVTFTCCECNHVFTLMDKGITTKMK